MSLLDSDKQLTQEIQEYQTVAKENPNVDVGMLMLNALENQKKNLVSAKAKRWAYLISISVPPVGLLLAAKYYWFSEEQDAQNVAWICVILTVICLAMFWIGAKLFFNTAGVSPSQIEQIKPSDINQILQ